MYTFRQISDYMNSGQVFTCTVVSYDRKRKAGGQLYHYEAMLLQPDNAGGRGRTYMEELRQRLATIDDEDNNRRDPNHRRWHTRNIRLLTNGHPTAIVKKIHLPLIIEFNNEPVVP